MIELKTSLGEWYHEQKPLGLFHALASRELKTVITTTTEHVTALTQQSEIWSKVCFHARTETSTETHQTKEKNSKISTYVHKTYKIK